MEIEKSLFKLSEKILLSSAGKNLCRAVCFLSLLLSFLSASVLITATILYSQGDHLLERCYSMENPVSSELFERDTLTMITFQHPDSLSLPSQQFLFLNHTENNCLIYKNTESKLEPDLIFSATPNLPALNKETLVSRGFKNFTVIVSTDALNLAERLFLGASELSINELIQSPYFSNISFYEVVFKGQNHYFQKFTTTNRISILLRAFVGVLGLSIISLLYIYATVISAPSFITNIIDLFKIPFAIPRVTIYKIFPWIGVYMHPLDQHQNSRLSSSYISNAMIFKFSFIYFTYFGLMVAIGNLIFTKVVPGALNENFFGVVAGAEFCSLLFLRTRTSIKYFPFCFVVLQIMLIYYCSMVDFGYKNWMLAFDVAMSMLTLSFLITKLEIPAQAEWDKLSVYTPTEQRPRVLYFPHYNLNWNNDISDIETIAIPSFSRSEFLAEELVLVDENYDLMNEILTINQLQ